MAFLAVVWGGSSQGGPETPERSIVLVLGGRMSVWPLCVGRKCKTGKKWGGQEDPWRCWLGEEAVRKRWDWSCSELVAQSPGPLPMQNSDQGLRAPYEHMLRCCGFVTCLSRSLEQEGLPSGKAVGLVAYVRAMRC